MTTDLRDDLLRLNALPEEGDEVFTNTWMPLNMHLVCYATQHKRLGTALKLMHSHAGLPNTKASMMHLTFVLLNILAMLGGNKLKAIAYPGSPDTIVLWAKEDNPQGITETLIRVVDALHACGYVRKVSGAEYMRRQAAGGRVMNRLIPTPKLFDEVIVAFKLLKLPLRLLKSQNYVLVTQKKVIKPGHVTRYDVPLSRFRSADDKSLIKASNKLLRAYNRLLKDTDITLSQGEIPEGYTNTVYRKFCRSSLMCGGRLYGGFWQNLPSGKRGEIPSRRDILLDEQETIELDYSGFHINMLYAWEGKEPFEGDPYQLANWPREIVKQYILIAINAETDGFRALREAVKNDPLLVEYYPLLLKGGCEALKRAFAEKHPRIAKYLHSDVGVELQRQDSEIAMHVIGQMMDLYNHISFIPEPIPVLNVHDSFICPAEFEVELEDCMKSSFKRVMGTTTTPIIKRSWR